MSIISEDELNQIVELAETVPERYRDKSFEILLSYTLQPSKTPPGSNFLPSDEGDESGTGIQRDFINPIDVKAFLSQYDLDENILWKYFLADGQEIRPIYQLEVTQKTKAQTQHALMMSLENSLKTGDFEVNIEQLRVRCQDQKCYDGSNFKKTIKSTETLFRQVEDVESLTLSPEGKGALADLLEELAEQDG